MSTLPDRPMVIKFGGYISKTPPLPLYAIGVARWDYRKSREHQPRHIARAHAMAFLLSVASERVRPTTEHAAWCAVVQAKTSAA